MINQSPYYRILKGIIDFTDRDTNIIISIDTVIDMGDVGSFEKYGYDNLKSKGEHVTLYFTNNKPPINLRYKYLDFCELFEKHLVDKGALDNRGQKKTLNYSGMMKAQFMNTKQYSVTTFYPEGYTFLGKTNQDVNDAILLNEIRPLN